MKVDKNVAFRNVRNNVIISKVDISNAILSIVIVSSEQLKIILCCLIVFCT